MNRRSPNGKSRAKEVSFGAEKISPVVPLFRGEGLGVRDQTYARFSSHTWPLSKEYRGEGNNWVAAEANAQRLR